MRATEPGLAARLRPDAGMGSRSRCCARRRPTSTGCFPATGGALYGPATHGWMSSFQRPSAASRLPGLYLAGGSVHPGPGVPMAAMCGPAGGRDAAGAPRFDQPVAPGGYLWWYVDALSDDGRHGLTHHRLRRQRLLALLRLGPRARRRAGRPREPLLPERGAVRRRRAPLDDDRARPAPCRAQRSATSPSARASCTGTAQCAAIDIDEVGMPLPQRVRGRVRVWPQGLSRFVTPLDDGGRHRWGPIAPVRAHRGRLRPAGPALVAAMPTWIRTRATSRSTGRSRCGTGRARRWPTAAPR